MSGSSPRRHAAAAAARRTFPLVVRGMPPDLMMMHRDNATECSLEMAERTLLVMLFLKIIQFFRSGSQGTASFATQFDQENHPLPPMKRFFLDCKRSTATTGDVVMCLLGGPFKILRMVVRSHRR